MEVRPDLSKPRTSPPTIPPATRLALFARWQVHRLPRPAASGYESDRFRLMLFDGRRGRRRVWQRTLMAGWHDRLGSGFESHVILDRKSRRIAIYKIGVDDGKIGKIASGYDDDFSVIDGDGQFCYAGWRSGSPSQIYVSGTSLLTSKNCVEDRFSPPGLPASSETRMRIA